MPEHHRGDDVTDCSGQGVVGVEGSSWECTVLNSTQMINHTGKITDALRKATVSACLVPLWTLHRDSCFPLQYISPGTSGPLRSDAGECWQTSSVSSTSNHCSVRCLWTCHISLLTNRTKIHACSFRITCVHWAEFIDMLPFHVFELFSPMTTYSTLNRYSEQLSLASPVLDACWEGWDFGANVLSPHRCGIQKWSSSGMCIGCRYHDF